MAVTSEITTAERRIEPAASLLSLPTELLLQCLSHLDPCELVALSAVSRMLYQVAATESLWYQLVNRNLIQPIHTPGPLRNFKELYIAHHPRWFLLQHRLWVADTAPAGNLVMTTFNPDTAAIQGLEVVAATEYDRAEFWTHDPNVIIAGFHPHVQLHRERPVINLEPHAERIRIAQDGSQGLSGDFLASSPKETPPLMREVLMKCAHGPSQAGLRSSFVLARDHPEHLTNPGSAVWPDQRLPAPTRTRNASATDFASDGHRPKSLSEVSQNCFRIRRWIEYNKRRNSSNLAQFSPADRLTLAAGLTYYPNLDRRSQSVATFGTLDPAAYTPTPSKPWRGVYCGDYNPHGCEFLIVLQPDPGDEIPLPENARWMYDWLVGSRQQERVRREELTRRTFDRHHQIMENYHEHDDWGAISGDEEDERNGDNTDHHVGNAGDASSSSSNREPQTGHEGGERNGNPGDEQDDDADLAGRTAQIGRQTQDADPSLTNDNIYTGQLVAIKLTGDTNVPRAQITFIAPDLSDRGLVRTADEEVFRGARLVRSAGHVANTGFMHDEYIPCELILLSTDRLAHYWQGFRHISFYQRVDLDALVDARLPATTPTEPIPFENDETRT